MQHHINPTFSPLVCFVGACVLFTHVQPVVPLIMHLQNRQSPQYWPSKYLPQYIYEFLPVAILYALTDLYFSYFAIFGAMLGMLLVGTCLPLSQSWLILLR